MKRYFLKDYILFVTAKLLSWFFRALPMEFALYLAKLIGAIGYYIDRKHRRIVYTNIKVAFGQTKQLEQINEIVKKTFQNFCQHIVEVLCLPKISYGYIEKYVEFENKDLLLDTIRQNKGVIFSSMHFGSWELSFILCDRLGPPFRIVAREHTKYKMTDRLLNVYRQMKPGSVLYRGNNPREMIRVIKNREILGLVVDQGGKEGQLVEFFGRRASMPTGALRLALKFNTPFIIVFIIRKRGPFHKIIIKKIDIEKTEDIQKDIEVNLRKIIKLSEEVISQYPEQYMWFYKVWKYTDERKIIILNDGKIGHLRQSQAAAKILAEELEKHNLKPKIEILDIRFKNNIAKALLVIFLLPIGKYHCQGCFWYLKRLLQKSSYKSLPGIKADFIVSCGSSISSLNYILSNDSLAKSISILKPNLLSTDRFNLVIMPRHDRPSKKKNVVITEGSLNLINRDYLARQSEMLIRRCSLLNQDKMLKIGILLGGDTKRYKMSYQAIDTLISELKKISEKLNLQIFLTTSRRTPSAIEDLIKRNLKDFSRCKLLIIANESNIPEAVGGILGVSEIVIVSDDSISMISEAASSQRYVIVVQTTRGNISGEHRHRIFLRNLNEKGYIYLAEPENVFKIIEWLLTEKPKIKRLDDTQILRSAISKIL
jgi:KDO2-lipid IV(A) lauroyltransferase